MNLADVLEAMAISGCTSKQMADVASYLSKIEDTRSPGAIRQARYRERHKASQTVTSQTVTDASQPVTVTSRNATPNGFDKESPHTPKEITSLTPLPPPASSQKTSSSSKKLVPEGTLSSFEKFYKIYPKHIHRKAALEKFEVAAKAGVEPASIVAAAARYAEACKATELQFIKAPDAWLHKGCYDDELPFANGHDPPHDKRTPEQKRDDWIRVQNELARDGH